MTYTRFGADGSTPMELVRSFDGGRTWTPPSVIVPNLDDTFNQATQPVVTPTGRVIVTWFARTFPAPAFVEREQRIEVGAAPTTAACTFGPPVIVRRVNPQGEPPGYNRARPQLLNTPYIAVDKGRDDGVITTAKDASLASATSTSRTSTARRRSRRSQLRRRRLSRAAGDILLSRRPTTATTFRAAGEGQRRSGRHFARVSKRPGQQARRGLRHVARSPPRSPTEPADRYLGRYFLQPGRRSAPTAHQHGVDRLDHARGRQPDFGDYNSSDVIKFQCFVSIWADGRFPTPAPLTPTGTGSPGRQRSRRHLTR